VAELVSLIYPLVFCPIDYFMERCKIIDIHFVRYSLRLFRDIHCPNGDQHMQKDYHFHQRSSNDYGNNEVIWRILSIPCKSTQLFRLVGCIELPQNILMLLFRSMS
jgi:hypothetical protein